MKLFFTSVLSITTIGLFAQNVGINTDGSAPGMMLDIKTTTTTASDGLRINNPNAGDGDAIINFQNAGTSVWTMGFDDSDADKFKFAGSGALGTTDYVTILTNGDVGIGITAPTTQLHVVSAGVQDAIFGTTPNVGGVLGRETNITFGTPVQNLLGSGVYAANPTAGYTSAYAQSTGAATVAANISYSSVWIPNYNYAENTSGVNSPAALYGYLSNTSTTLGADQIAINGFSDRGTTAGNPGYTIGVQGLSNAQNQDAFAVQGLAFSNSTTRAGGYFEAFNYAGTSQAYAFVATSLGGVNRKITGTNAVSEIIPTANHGRVTLTCPESPEYWYQDYGSVNLVNGKAHVDLDPILADIIVVDANNPIRVYCTPVEMTEFNGVTITNKTATGFDIVELNNGTHTGIIDYQIIVKPKTGFGEGRFPQAPGPAWLKKSEEPASAKAANQPLGRDVYQWPADWDVYGYQDLAKKKIEEMRSPKNATIPENK
jgi:hypothetical protein